MATNDDYWKALASRYGRLGSQLPGAARDAGNSVLGGLRSGASRLGSAAQAYSRLPLDLARTAGGAVEAFGSALATGEDPYEMAGPLTSEIQAPMPTFEDVRSGASTSMPPMMPPPPAEDPPIVTQAGGSLRYKLPGGEWREFKGGDTAPTIGTGTISDPEDPMRPHSYTPTSGGGTVSMMTAPQNAGIVTEASRGEDLTRQINERMARMTLEDPNWRERAKSESKVGEAVAIEQGKAQVARQGQQQILQQLDAYDRDVDEGLQSQLREAQSNAAFMRLPPEERDRIVGAAQAEADEAKRAYRERVGMATGNVSVSMRPGAMPF